MERSAKEGGVEEEVLGYAEEETEEGGCGEGEVGVWIDFEMGPGVDHGQEGEVGVGSVAGWNDGGRSTRRCFGIGRARWGALFRRPAGSVEWGWGVGETQRWTGQGRGVVGQFA